MNEVEICFIGLFHRFFFFMGKHFLNTAVLYSFILILLQCDLYVKIIYLYTKNVSAALTEMSYGDLKKKKINWHGFRFTYSLFSIVLF